MSKKSIAVNYESIEFIKLKKMNLNFSTYWQKLYLCGFLDQYPLQCKILFRLNFKVHLLKIDGNPILDSTSIDI